MTARKAGNNSHIHALNYILISALIISPPAAERELNSISWRASTSSPLSPLLTLASLIWETNWWLRHDVALTPACQRCTAHTHTCTCTHLGAAIWTTVKSFMIVIKPHRKPGGDGIFSKGDFEPSQAKVNNHERNEMKSFANCQIRIVVLHRIMRPTPNLAPATKDSNQSEVKRRLTTNTTYYGKQYTGHMLLI